MSRTSEVFQRRSEGGGNAISGSPSHITSGYHMFAEARPATGSRMMNTLTGMKK